MKEIEVEEYIRTKAGTIDKIIKIYTEDTDLKNVVRGENGSYWKEKILKHSHNIIDLIEVGDYVNGKKIDAILDGGFKNEGVAERVLCFEIDFPIEKGLRAYHNYDIKSIVTHEQFKQAEYRVEE